MKLTTTLALLRQNNACDRGYNLIANHVGQDFTGQIDLLTILDVNGQADCLWALRATEQSDGALVAVAFAIRCAEPYCTDEAWRAWATNWMNGSDRSQKAAEAARAAAWAARAAEAAEAARAAAAAEAWAAWAARAAAAEAAEAARAAAWAARAAAAEAARAARAARAADDKHRQLAILRELLS